MSVREPKTTAVFGMKGTGKTYTTKNVLIRNYVKTIGNQQARPVLIFDVNGEFTQFKAVAYDAFDEDEHSRTINIRKIKKPAVYRLLAIHPDETPFSDEQALQAIQDISMNFKNGLFLLEDINAYITSSVPKMFYARLTRNRHVGVDLTIHYQRIGDPPPKIIGNLDYIRLHKTVDSVTAIPNKYPNYEIIRLAELCVDFEVNIGNKYYFCYIDLAGNKLMKINAETFNAVCPLYVVENKSRDIKNIMQIDAITKEKAIQKIISNLKSIYL